MRGTASPIGRWGFAIAAAASMSAAPLLAADKLPKDGAWARYYVLHKDPDGTERTIRTMIRFVGTVREKGERCRYVEWTDAMKVDGGDGKKTTRRFVYKFLLTEKSLRESPQPLLQFVRGWRGEEGKTPEPLVTSQSERERANFGGTTVLFLPGVLKTTKPTRDSRTVDYQQGQLRIKSGRSGTYQARYHAITAPVNYNWKTEYELWLHKDVPLGFASARHKTVLIRQREKGKKTVRDLGTTEWWVEAWGTGAKSVFPSAK